MDVNVKIRSTVAFTFKNAKFCEAPNEKEIIIITPLVYVKQRVNDMLYFTCKYFDRRKKLPVQSSELNATLTETFLNY